MHQYFRGFFRGPLVLRTFAAHFAAVNGAVEVAGLKDEPARGSLVLAAASVSSRTLACE